MSLKQELSAMAQNERARWPRQEVQSYVDKMTRWAKKGYGGIKQNKLDIKQSVIDAMKADGLDIVCADGWFYSYVTIFWDNSLPAYYDRRESYGGFDGY